MSAENLVGLVLSALLLGYLVAAFLVPERVLMSAAAWAQFALLVFSWPFSIPLLGGYMAKVYGNEHGAR